MMDAFTNRWIVEHGVSRETIALWSEYVDLIKIGSLRQNLISANSIETIWQRHIIDSAQLGVLVDQPASWIDIGSGAGLPGVVIAAMLPALKMRLIEPRTLRAAFLRETVQKLGLAHRVEVICTSAEQAAIEPSDVISARAVASAPKVIAAAHHLSSNATTWLLPKGRSVARELEEVCTTWQGAFHIVPSVTAPESRILVGRGVQRRRT